MFFSVDAGLWLWPDQSLITFLVKVIQAACSTMITANSTCYGFCLSVVWSLRILRWNNLCGGWSPSTLRGAKLKLIQFVISIVCWLFVVVVGVRFRVQRHAELAYLASSRRQPLFLLQMNDSVKSLQDAPLGGVCNILIIILRLSNAHFDYFN